MSLWSAIPLPFPLPSLPARLSAKPSLTLHSPRLIMVLKTNDKQTRCMTYGSQGLQTKFLPIPQKCISAKDAQLYSNHIALSLQCLRSMQVLRLLGILCFLGQV